MAYWKRNLAFTWCAQVLSLSGFGFVIPFLPTFAIGGVEPNVQSALSAKTERDRRGLLFGIQTLVGNAGWVFGPLVGGWISLHFGIGSVFSMTAAVLGVTMAIGTYRYWYTQPKSLPS